MAHAAGQNVSRRVPVPRSSYAWRSSPGTSGAEPGSAAGSGAVGGGGGGGAAGGVATGGGEIVDGLSIVAPCGRPGISLFSVSTPPASCTVLNAPTAMRIARIDSDVAPDRRVVAGEVLDDREEHDQDPEQRRRHRSRHREWDVRPTRAGPRSTRGARSSADRGRCRGSRPTRSTPALPPSPRCRRGRIASCQRRNRSMKSSTPATAMICAPRPRALNLSMGPSFRSSSATVSEDSYRRAPILQANRPTFARNGVGPGS